MSDSFEDYPPDRALKDQMTTAEINEAISIKYVTPEPDIAAMQATILDLSYKVRYWQDAFKHCLYVKGSCSCQGRAEKLWCQRCKYITKYEQQTGEKCR